MTDLAVFIREFPYGLLHYICELSVRYSLCLGSTISTFLRVAASACAGVGKTAIAEGLAYAIVHDLSLEGQPLPVFLRNKRVLQLDVGLLMAGAKERGELENRVTKLMQETRDSGDVILM